MFLRALWVVTTPDSDIFFESKSSFAANPRERLLVGLSGLLGHRILFEQEFVTIHFNTARPVESVRGFVNVEEIATIGLKVRERKNILL